MALPPVPAAVTAARLVARDVTARAIGPADADAAELAVSEMVTAALAGVEEAPDGPPVRVLLQVEGRHVAVEVGAVNGRDTRADETAEWGVQILTHEARRIEMRVDESGAVRRIELGDPSA